LIDAFKTDMAAKGEAGIAETSSILEEAVAEHIVKLKQKQVDLAAGRRPSTKPSPDHQPFCRQPTSTFKLLRSRFRSKPEQDSREHKCVCQAL
jgi:hypothetical protein